MDYYELSLFCENKSDDRPMFYRHNRIYAEASDIISFLIVTPYKRWSMFDFQVRNRTKGMLWDINYASVDNSDDELA